MFSEKTNMEKLKNQILTNIESEQSSHTIAGISVQLLAIAYQIKHIPTLQLKNFFLGIYPGEIKDTYIKTFKRILINIFTYDSLQQEMTHISIHRRMDKQM